MSSVMFLNHVQWKKGAECDVQRGTHSWQPVRWCSRPVVQQQRYFLLDRNSVLVVFLSPINAFNKGTLWSFGPLEALRSVRFIAWTPFCLYCACVLKQTSIRRPDSHPATSFTLFSYTVPDARLTAVMLCAKTHSNVPAKQGKRQLLACKHGCKQCKVFRKNLP